MCLSRNFIDCSCTILSTTFYISARKAGLVMSKMPHVRQSHAIKHVLWTCFMTIAGPKDLWHAIKKFWIKKVARKVYLQLWQQSHWHGSGVSEECSKSEHLNGGLQFYLHQSPSSEVNYQKDSVCNMFSEGLCLLCCFRFEH